jgi:hypothetical protein
MPCDKIDDYEQSIGMMVCLTIQILPYKYINFFLHESSIE